MLQRVKTIVCLAIIVCLLCPSILAENVYGKIEVQLEVYNMYVLDNSEFYLILRLKREDDQKINNDQIECTLLLPENMYLVSQSNLNPKGRIDFKVRVSSPEEGTRLGIFINNKKDKEIFGYWTKFNGVILLSPVDRIIANISLPLGILGGMAVIWSLLADLSSFSIWTGKTTGNPAVTYGSLVLFAGGMAGMIYTNKLFMKSEPSFVQLEGADPCRLLLNAMSEEELNYYKKLIIK